MEDRSVVAVLRQVIVILDVPLMTQTRKIQNTFRILLTDRVANVLLVTQTAPTNRKIQKTVEMLQVLVIQRCRFIPQLQNSEEVDARVERAEQAPQTQIAGKVPFRASRRSTTLLRHHWYCSWARLWRRTPLLDNTLQRERGTATCPAAGTGLFHSMWHELAQEPRQTSKEGSKAHEQFAEPCTLALRASYREPSGRVTIVIVKCRQEVQADLGRHTSSVSVVADGNKGVPL